MQFAMLFAKHLQSLQFWANSMVGSFEDMGRVLDLFMDGLKDSQNEWFHEQLERGGDRIEAFMAGNPSEEEIATFKAAEK